MKELTKDNVYIISQSEYILDLLRTYLQEHAEIKASYALATSYDELKVHKFTSDTMPANLDTGLVASNIDSGPSPHFSGYYQFVATLPDAYVPWKNENCTIYFELFDKESSTHKIVATYEGSLMEDDNVVCALLPLATTKGWVMSDFRVICLKDGETLRSELIPIR